MVIVPQAEPATALAAARSPGRPRSAARPRPPGSRRPWRPPCAPTATRASGAVAAERTSEQQQDGHERGQVGRDQDRAPVEPVGDRPGVRQQQRVDPGVGGQHQRAPDAAAGQLGQQHQQRHHDEPVGAEHHQLGPEQPPEVTVAGKDREGSRHVPAPTGRQAAGSGADVGRPPSGRTSAADVRPAARLPGGAASAAPRTGRCIRAARRCGWPRRAGWAAGLRRLVRAAARVRHRASAGPPRPARPPRASASSGAPGSPPRARAPRAPRLARDSPCGSPPSCRASAPAPASAASS